MSPDDSLDEPGEPEDEIDREELPSAQKTVSAVDKRGHKRTQKWLREREQRADAEIRKLLSTEEGRFALWRILGPTEFSIDRFMAGPSGVPDPMATYFKSGQQAYGLRLYFQLLKIDRGSVLLMQDENDPMFEGGTPRR